MVLTFRALAKNGKSAIYTGLRTVKRFNLIDFIDGVTPETLDISGPLVAERKPRAKLTAEEKAANKLARKNAPKPTQAERIARAEARLAKMKAAAAVA
jgi:hypothetical protein